MKNFIIYSMYKYVKVVECGILEQFLEVLLVHFQTDVWFSEFQSCRQWLKDGFVIKEACLKKKIFKTSSNKYAGTLYPSEILLEDFFILFLILKGFN